MLTKYKLQLSSQPHPEPLQETEDFFMGAVTKPAKLAAQCPWCQGAQPGPLPTLPGSPSQTHGWFGGECCSGSSPVPWHPKQTSFPALQRFPSEIIIVLGLPWWLSGEESAFQAGDVSLIPESRRPPGEGNGNPIQDSCLKNPHG